MDPFAVHDQAGRSLGDLHTLAREFEDSVVIQNSESDLDGSGNNLSSDSGSDNGGNAGRRPLTTHDLEKMLAPSSHQANPTPAAAKQELATDETSRSSYESADRGSEVDEEAKPLGKDSDSEEERVLQRTEATDDDKQEDGLSDS